MIYLLRNQPLSSTLRLVDHFTPSSLPTSRKYSRVKPAYKQLPNPSRALISNHALATFLAFGPPARHGLRAQLARAPASTSLVLLLTGGPSILTSHATSPRPCRRIQQQAPRSTRFADVLLLRAAFVPARQTCFGATTHALPA